MAQGSAPGFVRNLNMGISPEFGPSHKRTLKKVGWLEVCARNLGRRATECLDTGFRIDVRLIAMSIDGWLNRPNIARLRLHPRIGNIIAGQIPSYHQDSRAKSRRLSRARHAITKSPRLGAPSRISVEGWGAVAIPAANSLL